MLLELIAQPFESAEQKFHSHGDNNNGDDEDEDARKDVVESIAEGDSEKAATTQ